MQQTRKVSAPVCFHPPACPCTSCMLCKTCSVGQSCLHLLTVMIWSDRYLFLLHVHITPARQCLWAVFFLFGFQAYRLQLTAPLSMCVFSVSVRDYMFVSLCVCFLLFSSVSSVEFTNPADLSLQNNPPFMLSSPLSPSHTCRSSLHGKIESWYHQEAITDITTAFHSPVCVTCKNMLNTHLCIYVSCVRGLIDDLWAPFTFPNSKCIKYNIRSSRDVLNIRTFCFKVKHSGLPARKP